MLPLDSHSPNKRDRMIPLDVVFCRQDCGTYHGRHVRFDDEITTHKPVDYSYDLDDVWYSEFELAVISKDCRSMLARMRRALADNSSHHSHDNDEFCLRGLEEHTSIRASIEVRTRKVSVKQSVLDAQRLQRFNGAHNEEAIARVSRETSVVSKAVALARAEADSREVMCMAPQRQYTPVDSHSQRSCQTAVSLQTKDSLDCYNHGLGPAKGVKHIISPPESPRTVTVDLAAKRIILS